MSEFVDVDVHEPLDQHGIDRYVDPVWTGWHPILPPLPYRMPGASRAQAQPSFQDVMRGGAPAGAPVTYESIRELVLDRGGLAVLSGTVHPGNAVTQFEYHAAFTRAYNDWLMKEWLDRDERLYGSVQVMSQMPEDAAAEVERCASHPRMVQVVLPARGGEGYGLKKYRPILEAAARNDLVVTLRVSASSRSAAGYGEHLAEWQAGVSQSVMGQVLSLVFSGLFDEHPSLKVLCVGAGWTFVPYLMWTMDSNYRPLRAEVPWVPKLPSEYFPDHLFFCVHPVPSSADPRHLRETVEMAGHDRWLVWGSDYPNRGWATPESVLDGVFDEGLKRKILRDNARRLYTRLSA